jgi:transcriptional regulator with XRE-family HTH domain
VAKKTRARGADTDVPRKRRGGRRPGSWDLVDPDEFKGWRQEQRLSRARLASALGVSSTSIQNWETGNAIPSRRYQERLAELMKTGIGALGTSSLARPGEPAGAVSAVGPIVAAYLQHHPDLTEEQLLSLVKNVRQALA